MEWLTPQQTATILGVSPSTVRNRLAEGRLECRRINGRGDRRISRASIAVYLDGKGAEGSNALREALYARVSGRGDQLSSLDAQEEELRASSEGEIVLCVREVGSGLNEGRRGLRRILRAAERGKIDRVTVTHADRLTRFGGQTLAQLLGAHGVEVRVLHDAERDSSAEEELFRDFMSLLSSFSGRLYGQRSAQARRRLLAKAGGGDE